MSSLCMSTESHEKSWIFEAKYEYTNPETSSVVAFFKIHYHECALNLRSFAPSLLFGGGLASFS